MIVGLLLGSTLGGVSFADQNITTWVRDMAHWWSTSQISDAEFAKGLKYLINNDIIKISQRSDNSEAENIPSWLRTNAGWWSQGLLSDDEFVKTIQYLVDNGIITVEYGQSICSGNALCIISKVERIVDGDTIYIQGYEVRLSLTNTPEIFEPGYSEATLFTKWLCPVGSIVTVDQDDKQPYDVYNRLLGKVYCGDKVLNSELLFNGHANILTRYCSTSEFSDEDWAQSFGCGIGSNNSVKSGAKSEKTELNDCDVSYPDFCIAPPPPDLDCKDITKRFTVLQPDPHKFDGDKDGIGC